MPTWRTLSSSAMTSPWVDIISALIETLILGWRSAVEKSRGKT